MIALLLPVAAALFAGTLHALEADHMAAVTAFAVRRPGAREAVRFGVRWSVGHGGAILLVGAVLVGLGVYLPEGATHVLERLVGAVMIGLGVWTLAGAAKLHAHPHSHDGSVHMHVHSHAVVGGHDHGHAVTVVGMVHGLAGSGSAVLLIPVATFDTPALSLLYLLLFAVGTIAGMAAYGLLAGVIVARTAERSVNLARLVARVTGVFTVGIGLIWLLR